MKHFYSFTACFIILCDVADSLILSQPVHEKCKNRPKEFDLNGQNFFYSGNRPEMKGRTVTWIEARNYCRQFCMDTISIESQNEFDMVKKLLEEYLISYIWTSGRVCDDEECDTNLEPSKWYWTHNNVQIQEPSKTPENWKMNPWSHTGYKNQPQPDNAEFDVNGKNESCLAVLHNVYDDGIKFHDVACYHKKPFICEDSKELLKRVNVV